MTRYSYCVQWFRGQNCPSQMLTEDEARARHFANELYTALVGDALSPSCFVEVTAFRAIFVEFLDIKLRRYRDYEFQEVEPGRLLVTGCADPTFPNDKDPPDRATTYLFKPTGEVRIDRFVANPDGVGSRLVDSRMAQTDVTNNWEPYPDFGHYDGLIRLNRGIPLLPVLPEPKR